MAKKRSTIESGTADRLIFFSDAVVAIAITLLAVDLPIPLGTNVHAFWASVHRNDHEYLSFVISFVVVAVSWAHHHDVFRYLVRTDVWMRRYNMVWLLTIVLNPFATRMLTTEGHDSQATNALRWGFYALVQVVSAIAFLAMIHHMTAYGLQSDDAPPNLVPDSNWQTSSLIIAFGLSIPLFFVIRWAWVLWIVTPFVVGQLRRRHDRAR